MASITLEKSLDVYIEATVKPTPLTGQPSQAFQTAPQKSLHTVYVPMVPVEFYQ